MEIICSTGWNAYWLWTLKGIFLTTLAARPSPVLGSLLGVLRMEWSPSPCLFKSRYLLLALSIFSRRSATLHLLLHHLIDFYSFIYCVINSKLLQSPCLVGVLSLQMFKWCLFGFYTPPRAVFNLLVVWKTCWREENVYNSHVSMLINWKRPNWSLVENWIDKIRHVHMSDYNTKVEMIFISMC